MSVFVVRLFDILKVDLLNQQVFLKVLRVAKGRVFFESIGEGIVQTAGKSRSGDGFIVRQEKARMKRTGFGRQVIGRIVVVADIRTGISG